MNKHTQDQFDYRWADVTQRFEEPEEEDKLAGPRALSILMILTILGWVSAIAYFVF